MLEIPFQRQADLLEAGVTMRRDLGGIARRGKARQHVPHLRHVEPRLIASGKDDDRARTVYPEDDAAHT